MGIFVGIMLLSVASLCLAQIISERRKYKHIDQWLQVDGEIVDNRSIHEDIESPAVQVTTYRYQVRGIQYKNSIRTNFSNFLAMNTYLGDYQQGDKIQVLHDPDNPKQAILSNYDINILYEPFGVGFIFFISGILCILFSMNT